MTYVKTPWKIVHVFIQISFNFEEPTWFWGYVEKGKNGKFE